MGKFLIITGIILVLAGVAIHFGPRIPFFGRLPGDIYFEYKNTRVYIPLVSGLIISILVSLALLLISKVKQ